MPFPPKRDISYKLDDSGSLITIDRSRRFHESLHLATYVVGRPNFADHDNELYSLVNALGADLSLLDGVTKVTISQYRIHMKVAALFNPRGLALQADTFVDAYLEGVHGAEEATSD